MNLYFDTEFIEDGKTIDLISIGIVREDGAMYYAELDVNWGKASDWVKENVRPHLLGTTTPRAQVAREVVDFAGPDPIWWAYFADYDWVALCQLYGRMIDLPDGWPMYCRDLKQLADYEDVDTSSVPKPATEHHALADAQWNQNLHKEISRAVWQRFNCGDA